MAKEYIERDALIELANYHVDGAIDAYDIALFPAADVVEAVRFKECKYSEDKTYGGDYLCNRKMLGLVRPNDFCSFGERRDNNAAD